MKIYVTLRKTININSQNHEVIGVYRDYKKAKNDIDLKAANDVVEVELEENDIYSVMILLYKTNGAYLAVQQYRYVGCFLNKKEIDFFLEENESLYGQYFIQEIKII